MNAILGFTQLVLDNDGLNSDDREHLQVVHRAGGNLLNLINDVLEMSKIEAGQIELASVDFDVHQMFIDIYELFNVSASAKGLYFKFEIAPSLPKYGLTDEGKLRQILTNLIGNALKFTETGGVVVKASGVTTDDGFRLVATIEDTGAGIDEHEQAAMFDAFQQTASSRGKGGTGLGLAICRKLSVLMGGEITACSALDKGSAFQLTVPLKISVGRPSLCPLPVVRVIGFKSDGPEIRILIVDDQRDNRLLLRRILEPIGFVLSEASNGIEAVEVWRQWQPQAILMDIVMPELGGNEATRQIRELPNGATATIIAVSASAFDEERAAVLANGADDFIRKPIIAEDLLATLGRHLGLSYQYTEVVSEERAVLSMGARALPQERLLAISPDLRHEMAKAVFNSDDQTLLGLIDQLPPHLDELAVILRHIVGRFEWDTLEHWFEYVNETT